MPTLLRAPVDSVGPGKYWDLDRIGAAHAWERVTTAQPVVVAVVDSGIDVAQPDLVPHLWVNAAERAGGANGIDDDGLGVIDDVHGARLLGRHVDGEVHDDDGHGTLLGGTITGAARGRIGLAGTLQPVKLMAVKFFDPLTLPAPANAEAAIRYAVRLGADIVSASWDVGIQTRALDEAIAYAESQGVLLVTAAGNFGSDNDRLPTWPASTRRANVLAVMATDERDERASFSNFGRHTVHLAAPGVEVLSTARSFRAPRWLPYSGTSAASAHVTAAAALLKAMNPAWHATVIRAHLMASAHRVAGLECIAGGRLDLRRAVDGPLSGLSPGDGETWMAGTDVTVRWARAYETPGCRTVSILLSEDGGRRYGILLAEERPNTGACVLRAPARTIHQARIRLMSDQGRFSTDSGVFSIA